MEIHIPRRIFLDTNLVNFTLDWGEAIFDGGTFPNGLSEQDLEDIHALRGTFLTGQRASWDVAISPKTYDEIMHTSDEGRRHDLKRWFNELWIYWRERFAREGLTDEYATSLGRRLVDSQYLTAFPDSSDRELIAHAIAYKCDLFCTRDRRSIIRNRHKVGDLGVRFATPAEGWLEVKPWASLWA